MSACAVARKVETDGQQSPAFPPSKIDIYGLFRRPAKVAHIAEETTNRFIEGLELKGAGARKPERAFVTAPQPEARQCLGLIQACTENAQYCKNKCIDSVSGP